MKIYSVKSTLDQIVNDIKSGELVIYCGAGISRNSGLPIVKHLVTFILQKLKLQQNEISKLFENSELKMPFESFMESLDYTFFANEILDIFSFGHPNKNHKFIAELMHADLLNYVVTTNFDKLIERATLQVDSRLLYDSVFLEKKFEKIFFDGQSKALVKIHGSIDNMEEMIITLRQVSNHNSIPSRKHIIDQTFSGGTHKSVLIFGYSSSDIFDLNVHIQAIAEGFKNVYYIEHHADLAYEEKINLKPFKNPFNKFPTGVRIFCDTNELINYLSESILKKDIDDNTLTDFDWKEQVNLWYNRTEIEPTMKYMFFGSLFYKIGHFDLAAKYYTIYFSALTKDHHKAEIIPVLIDCHRLNSNHDEAIRLGNEGLKLNIVSANIAITNNLAHLYLDRGDIPSAETIVANAFNSPALSDQNLSDLYALSAKINQQKNDYRKAIVDIKLAITYKKSSGSFTLEDELKLFGDLALYNIENNQYDEGLQSLKELLLKATAMDDNLSIASFTTDIALGNYRRGAISELEKFIVEFPQLLKFCTENKSIARAHQMAGLIFMYSLNNIESAIEHLKQAVYFSTLNKNRWAICMNHTHLGIAHYKNAVELGKSDTKMYSYHSDECKTNLLLAQKIVRKTDEHLLPDIELYLSLQAKL